MIVIPMGVLNGSHALFLIPTFKRDNITRQMMKFVKFMGLTQPQKPANKVRFAQH